MKLFRNVTLLFLMLSVLCVSTASAGTRIRCASTTSTQNSGLFDYLLPIVERETGIKVDVVAVGTGAALEIGKRGDADVLFVHAKDDELKLVKEGYFVNRHDVMYNDFIIVGPPDDPAGIKGLRSAVAAFKKISEMKTPFVSRGDNSGTNKKELKIWKKTGVTPKGDKWYLEVGQGMGKTLRIANEKKAYTLTDRGTWLALKDKEKLDMRIMVEGDKMLFNQYGVMAVNPERHPYVKYKEAMKFINFLISEKGQKAIAAYRDSRGNQLFHPDAK
ncbi:PBP superfamily domain protein [bacterium BMS3Bbin06]|nr:PBP superfamily domain protein [bacterium BMS3Bbin06]HDY70611.1 extracellular solute-binding protein [Nitrospirota bacterium]